MYQPHDTPNNTFNAFGENEKLGSVLVRQGKLKETDAFKICEFQQKKPMLFGEAAVRLKLVSKSDVEQALSTQFSFPYIDVKKNGLGPDLVIAHKPFDAEANAIRGIRTQLLFQWDKMEHPTLAIVSPAQGDGKSYLAANLAVSLAQIGKNTLLIDANLHNPRQHQIFNIGNRLGLSNLLTDEHLNKLVFEMECIDNLSLLPAGPIPPNPIELFSNANFRNTLDKYQKNFDVIIIDTPNAVGSSETKIISSMARNAIVVGRKDKTNIEQLKEMQEDLQSVDINILGGVLNRI